MPIEANATAAAAAVSAPQRISSERPTEGVQGRGDQENASAAFSQRTNVSIETAIDRDGGCSVQNQRTSADEC